MNAVVRYGEAFRDKGLWEGSLYVFDERMTVTFSDSAAVIGECDNCGSGTTTVVNCSNLECRHREIMCAACLDEPANLACDGRHDDRRVAGEVG